MLAHTVGAVSVAGNSTWQSMFGLEIPAAEKILRTLAVYLGLAVIMRLAGKRQLAQLNSVELTREAENATYGELRQAVLDLQHQLDERLAALDPQSSLDPKSP